MYMVFQIFHNISMTPRPCSCTPLVLALVYVPVCFPPPCVCNTPCVKMCDGWDTHTHTHVLLDFKLSFMCRHLCLFAETQLRLNTLWIFKFCSQFAMPRLGHAAVYRLELIRPIQSVTNCMYSAMFWCYLYVSSSLEIQSTW